MTNRPNIIVERDSLTVIKSILDQIQVSKQIKPLIKDIQSFVSRITSLQPQIPIIVWEQTL